MKGADPAPKPFLALLQWKELQETNKKEQSLPLTSVKPRLFTAACEKVQIATLRQLLQDSPQQAPTMTSVLSDQTGVLAAIEMSLMSADKATKLSLLSGFADSASRGPH